MRIAAFAGEFVALAAWTGQSEEELRQDEDFQAADRQHWTAWEHDQVTATVHSWRGPDGRHRLYFDRCRADSYGPLAAAISGECYTQIDAADLDAVEGCGRPGLPRSGSSTSMRCRLPCSTFQFPMACRSLPRTGPNLSR